MERKELFEAARNVGRSIRNNAYHAGYFVGSGVAVYATADGIMTGNKAELAVGITSAVVTYGKAALKVLPFEVRLENKSKGQ